MLLNFTLKNYRSFRNEKTFSMVAAPIHELEESLFAAGEDKILPVGVIYGANSSGKSNLLKGFTNMRDVLVNSVRLNPTDKLDYEPFLLDLDSAGSPTSYEVEFLIGSHRYRYGFEFDQTSIIAEWLFGNPIGKKEREYFTREGQDISIPNKTRFAEGVGKASATLPNRLFLSLVAQLNGSVSKKIMNWFEATTILSGVRKASPVSNLSVVFLSNNNPIGNQARHFFERTGLGFNDIEIEECEILDELFGGEYIKEVRDILQDGFKGHKMKRLLTTHNVYAPDGTVDHVQAFPQSKMESDGTQKIIDMSGQLFLSLQTGTLMVVDELDAKLHPILTRNIVRLFMDKESNPRGAQLIFATHDTTLLNLNYLRRDQIWFTEKDQSESTDLYSLVEFRDENGAKVRNDRNIAKDYINGRYGAIPYLK